jgi:ubiquinone/menaquinone biosynthesis C-methylase UbiE
MPIDFALQENRYSYTGREADHGWRDAIFAIVDPKGKRVADIGCGGGIYALAWSQLGASEVIGIDSSMQMVQAATEMTAAIPNITIQLGTATATDLDSESVDIVFERALIHHLASLNDCFQEAKRILRQGGTYIIQDRTLDDVNIPGSPEHLRGYFFECFPKLLKIEMQRRPESHTVAAELKNIGFAPVQTRTLWERRKTYASRDELADELRSRKGRSILHELTDTELDDLITYILSKLPANEEIVERDRWTLWHTEKN